jgi:hypothetical protein
MSKSKSIKQQMRDARKPSPVVHYNKEEIEIVNFLVGNGYSVNRAIDTIHRTYRNENSTYYKVPLREGLAVGWRYD